MATIQQAAQFDSLAYYITGKNQDGSPQFRSDTPDNLKTLPDGWSVYQAHTDPVTGQTDVVFTKAGDSQAYIAARGTDNITV